MPRRSKRSQKRSRSRSQKRSQRRPSKTFRKQPRRYRGKGEQKDYKILELTFTKRKDNLYSDRTNPCTLKDFLETLLREVPADKIQNLKLPLDLPDLPETHIVKDPNNYRSEVTAVVELLKNDAKLALEAVELNDEHNIKEAGIFPDAELMQLKHKLEKSDAELMQLKHDLEKLDITSES